MKDAKSVTSPFAGHHKLSSKECPSSKTEKEEMSKVPYQSAVGSLMYAMVCTRPDIAYAVGVVSRFMTNPGQAHWNAMKWILRYVKGTSRSSLCFGSVILCCKATQMQITLVMQILGSLLQVT